MQMDGARLVDELIGRPARTTPDKQIVFHRDTVRGEWHAINCLKLHSLVEEMQTYLQSSGIHRGAIVGIVLPSSVTWEVVRFACLQIGATVVGLDHHDLGDTFTHVVAISQAQYLITDEAAHQQLKLADYASVTAAVVIDTDQPTQPIEARARLISSTQPAGENARNRGHESDQRADVAAIVFTSGTGSKPKGIGYSATQIILAVSAILDAFPELDSTRRTACWLPLSNLFQQIVNLCALKAGAPIYFVEDPRKIMQLLPQIRPIVLVGVPRFFEKAFESISARFAKLPAPLAGVIDFLLRHAGSQTAAGRFWAMLAKPFFAPVRNAFGGQIAFFISGSAPMQPRLLQRFDALGLPIFEAYGLSENIVPVAVNRPAAYRFGSVGKPLGQNELKIASDGELWCRGPGVCRQYLKSEQQPSLDPDGFLATGDYAKLDADGYLWLTGRKSEGFKTSTGRLIAPTEIEACLAGIPAIDQAVAFGASRKFITLLITLRSPYPDTTGMLSIIGEVRRATRALANYKRPAGVVLLQHTFSPSDGELTANLKLKRRAVAQKYADRIDALYAKIEHNQFDADTLLPWGDSSFLARL